MFNVSFNSLLINADRAHKVPFRPNTVCAPIDLFEKWKLVFESPGSVGLDDSDDLANRPLWRDGDKEMDVIKVSVHFLEGKVGIVVNDSSQLQLQVGQHTLVDHLAAVFGRKDNVVVTEIDTVALVVIVLRHQ